MKIGIHLSIAGGVDKAVIKAKGLGVSALQIFLKNSNRWVGRDYSAEEIVSFKNEVLSGQVEVFAHSGYLINLAGSGEVLFKSIDAMRDELNRASTLGIEYIVVHPGSYSGENADEGISAIANSIDKIYSKNAPAVKILLETTAGQGKSIGHTFQQLQSIIERSENPERLGVCVDTCHAHASGYDLSCAQGIDRMLDDFSRIIGLGRLKLIHLNDSKKESGSRVDRHEHIGSGTIGLEGFRHLLHHELLRNVPVILETPKFNDDEADRMNLETVKKIMEE